MAKSGSISISYIVIYGDVIKDNILDNEIAIINYSSPAIIIVGDKTIVTPIPAKIIYNSPTIKVSGYKTIITPPQAVLEFGSSSYNVGLIDIVQVVPGEIVFTSDNISISEFETIIKPNPAILKLSSSNINIFGYHTIVNVDPVNMIFDSSIDISTPEITIKEIELVVVSPVKMVFSCDNNLQVIGDKTVILNNPVEIVFKSNNINVLSVKNLITVDLPTLSLVVKDDSLPAEEVKIDMALPLFSMAVTDAGSFNAKFQSLSMLSNGSANKLGSIKGIFPKLSVSMESGSVINAEFPSIGLDIGVDTQYLSNMIMNLPKFSLLARSTHSGANDVTLVFPNLKMGISAITGEVANISNLLPSMSMTVSAITGEVVNISGTLPILKSRMTGIKTGDNDLVLELELFKMVMESGEILEEVLRYVRGEIR